MMKFIDTSLTEDPLSTIVDQPKSTRVDTHITSVRKIDYEEYFAGIEGKLNGSANGDDDGPGDAGDGSGA